METFYLMIPLTLLLSGAAVFCVIWAIRKGQFDDLDTPALRMLIEDNNRKENNK